MRFIALLAAVLLTTAACAAEPIGPPPQALRDSLKLADFYQKHIDCEGLPILSSRHVSDTALREAEFIVNKMLDGRDDVRKAIAGHGIRVVVMSPAEQTTDVPEHSDLKPKDYWDRRARGLGATLARPAISCGEENLLNLKGDRYPRECILVHEFAHTIHELGLSTVDPEFDGRLKKLFESAKEKGLWTGTYAMTNHKEYWAEAVQSYFDTNDAGNSQHNDVDTREELAKYDPAVFAVIDEAFRKSPWRYERYDKRRGQAPQ